MSECDAIITRKPLFVGFTGAAKSGKDTSAEFLKEFLESKGYKVIRTSFAEPIRKIGKIFGFTDDQLTDQNMKEVKDPFWGITPRRFMQIVGTEMFRNNLDPNCWVKLCIRNSMTAVDGMEEPRVPDTVHNAVMAGVSGNIWIPKAIVIISDVRFQNEADGIYDEGGFIIRVTRPSLDADKAEWRAHASEAQLNEIPHEATIENTSTIEKLNESVISSFCTVARTTKKIWVPK